VDACIHHGNRRGCKHPPYGSRSRRPGTPCLMSPRATPPFILLVGDRTGNRMERPGLGVETGEGAGPNDRDHGAANRFRRCRSSDANARRESPRSATSMRLVAPVDRFVMWLFRPADTVTNDLIQVSDDFIFVL
jgi:hypothetical protein